MIDIWLRVRLKSPPEHLAADVEYLMWQIREHNKQVKEITHEHGDLHNMQEAN